MSEGTDIHELHIYCGRCGRELDSFTLVCSCQPPEDTGPGPRALAMTVNGQRREVTP
ncbi:hypothetical protein SEA_EVAA_65 [Gordonia phage Evaa]|nr:hypothetical protein SEA_EVAA_65 [Gordonia phage Evaa]